jgi:hypothetical protein
MIFNAEGYAFPDYQKRTAHIWKNLMTRETAHWNTILKHTSSRRLAIDFGGHVGGTAIKFAQEFDNVVSFEPVPALYECLEYNTKDIDNIQIHSTGISNRSGSANIWVNPYMGQPVKSWLERDRESPNRGIDQITMVSS